MAGDWVLELLVKGKEMFQSADKRYVLLKFPSKTEKWVSGLVLRIKFSRASSLFFAGKQTLPTTGIQSINTKPRWTKLLSQVWMDYGCRKTNKKITL